MKRNNQPFIVSIEGNIGAGKSTMLKFFEKYADVELIPEPVAQWCDVNGHNLLGKLYEDPKRWKISNLQLTKLATDKKSVGQMNVSFAIIIVLMKNEF